MLPLRRFMILVPQHFFLFLPKFRKSPREFPEIFGNSQNFQGFPINSREFPYFQKKIRKKVKSPPPQLFYFSRNGNTYFSFCLMHFLGMVGGKIQFCVGVKLICFFGEKGELTFFVQGSTFWPFDIRRSHFDNFCPYFNHLGNRSVEMCP